MSTRLNARKVLSYVCLIALAIQGVTPDADDLASPRLPEMLASVARVLAPPPGDDIEADVEADAEAEYGPYDEWPADDDHGNSGPVHLCTGVSSPGSALVRSLVHPQAAPRASGWGGWVLTPARPGPVFPAHPAAGTVGVSRLLALCRLTC